MTLEATRIRLRNSIRQAISESGVDLSEIRPNDQNKLVEHIADGVLHEVDALLDAAAAPPPAPSSAPPAVAAQPATALAPTAAPAAPAEEQVLWEGRPFLSLVERYVVTDQRVRIITGLVGRANEDIEMIRIKDVDHTQGLSERVMGIGDVTLHSVDASRPVVVLRNVKDPSQVHEIVRKAMLESRKKYPYIFAQEL